MSWLSSTRLLLGRSRLLPRRSLLGGGAAARSGIPTTARFLSDDRETTLHSDSTVSDEDSSLIASKFKSQIVHKLWTERAKAKKDGSAKPMGGPSSCVTVTDGKTPCQSETKVEYPFTKDELLSESYKSPWNSMRIGKILEDLDALAGNIAFYHVRNEDNAVEHPLIVTASVDRIRLRKESPTMPCDQVLSGRVTYVGTSSMEIRMHCTSAEDTDPWLEAFFTFVTLDPTTKKPMLITPLKPQSPQEQADFDAGAQRAALKKQRRKQEKEGAHQIPPHAEALLRQARPVLLNMPSLASGGADITMAATSMQNALMAQPQSRNLHNRIFGGFLMRRAFELAFANAYVFGGARPVFREVDEISFAAPVDVGDLLVFNSRVLYTSSNDGATDGDYPMVHLEVETFVTEPELADAKLSNQFYFTFAIQGPTRPLRQILPANIDEATRMALRMEADKVQASGD
ncbi:Acyl-CoA thioesterase [Seminavis robusta]|uniref:Acyl-CoA thioesterase n=1 Tax=Seminavis robusta TaxID=568900 RepID=A0A9N8HJL8_9STRA|nr:Acyl-CoA thioesterase [Seminavis robusta]|eukprot:Sro559_g166520.1 Acyl-CoA thioesterase (458) ;mRNA; f:44776-46286